MYKVNNEVIAEYINDFVVDNLDGAGLVITDDQDLELEIDSISENSDWEYLRNEVFKQNKVEKLLEALKNEYFQKMLASPSQMWIPEIQTILDAIRELEN